MQFPYAILIIHFGGLKYLNQIWKDNEVHISAIKPTISSRHFIHTSYASPLLGVFEKL